MPGSVEVIHVDSGPRRGLYFRTAADRDQWLSWLSRSAAAPATPDTSLTGMYATPLYVATADDWAWLQIGLLARPATPSTGEG